jgi:acyl-homoserine lactone acylase PvdQ
MVNNHGFPSLAPQWDVVAPLLPVVAGTLAQPSQSYTQVVDLSAPDASLSLLPFGNSERPDSPFRFASWAEWVRGGLRPAPLSREAVEKLGISRQLLNRDASAAAASPPPDREDAR